MILCRSRLDTVLGSFASYTKICPSVCEAVPSLYISAVYIIKTKTSFHVIAGLTAYWGVSQPMHGWKAVMMTTGSTDWTTSTRLSSSSSSPSSSVPNSMWANRFIAGVRPSLRMLWWTIRTMCAGYQIHTLCTLMTTFQSSITWSGKQKSDTISGFLWYYCSRYAINNVDRKHLLSTEKNAYLVIRYL